MADKPKNGKDKFYKRPKPKVIEGGRKIPKITDMRKGKWDDFMKEGQQAIDNAMRRSKLAGKLGKAKQVIDISTKKAKQLAGLIPKDLSKKVIAGRVAGAIAGWGASIVTAGYLAHKYAKKWKKEKRQKSGTKHLGLKKQKKAYGGKVNTYSSPRRTIYKD